MDKLDNQNVVVIGGTSGIGLATAILAHEAGANVWAVGRSADRIASASANHPSILFSSLDIHDMEGLRALFAQIGEINHVVAAATGANRTLLPFLEQSQEQFREAFDKFWGYCNVIRSAAAYLTADASITLVSGTPARKANPGMSSLSCVGSAVEALTRALALEMAPKRVNVVAPGLISTGMFDRLGDNRDAALAKMTEHLPIKRAGHPEEVASAILLTMTNGYMTGTTLDVDGGTLLP
jgi:NAD(P)-dependent dehydrogenase (short-subunit alcohol dehydrogenase family)